MTSKIFERTNFFNCHPVSQTRFEKNDDVCKTLRKIKARKTCGSDNIYGILLKSCQKHRAQILIHIFQLSFDTQIVPITLKSAKIVPAPKSSLIIITQGVSLSLRRNPSLHACHNFLSLAMWLQVGPTYWIKSSHHLVLGRPRGLLFPWGIHSVILIVHLLSRLLATWPAHLCLLSLMLLIMSVKPLCFRIHSVLFLSFRVTPIMILSIFLWVVTSFSSWVLLNHRYLNSRMVYGPVLSRCSPGALPVLSRCSPGALTSKCYENTSSLCFVCEAGAVVR